MLDNKAHNYVNPCDKCIVSPMCKKSCESFTHYVGVHIKKYRHPNYTSNGIIKDIASAVRYGYMELCKDSEWGYKIIKERFIMRYYDRSM